VNQFGSTQIPHLKNRQAELLSAQKTFEVLNRESTKAEVEYLKYASQC
jgi:hypothetical protein